MKIIDLVLAGLVFLTVVAGCARESEKFGPDINWQELAAGYDGGHEDALETSGSDLVGQADGEDGTAALDAGDLSDAPDLLEPDGADALPPDIGPAPDLPRHEPEPLELIQCDTPGFAEGGPCMAQAGTNGALLLTGVVLGHDKTWVGGQVLVDADGFIACTACDCGKHELAASAVRITCPEGIVSPGLINAHDHLTYTHGHPADWGDERFEHRHDWRKGIRGHSKLYYTGGANELEVTWGEMRHLMSGVTSIAGSGQAKGFLRNIDKNGQEGLGQDPAFYNTFPLGDGDGTLLADGCDYPNIDGPYVLANDCYLPHVAEGIDKETRNEFLCLSSESNGGEDLTESNSAFIHSIGLTAVDGQVLASNGTAVIWSPRSNISLYGHTAQVPMYDRQGVLIGIGTDWGYSGSMNMQRELQCASLLNDRHYGHYFTEHELWLMATAGNALALSIGDVVGVLAQGKVADIAVFKTDGTANHHRAVIQGNIAETLLVLRGGTALYGATSLVQAVTPEYSKQCEAVPGRVCGEGRAICTLRETGYTFKQVAQANAENYDLFFCGEPVDEVTCIPFRAEPKGGQFDGWSTKDDPDGDAIVAPFDNCPHVFNAVRPVDKGVQTDSDGDGIGDACDPCPLDADTFQCEAPNPFDRDDDKVHDLVDNCPGAANPDQDDDDGDFIGNACDNCPDVPNPLNSACPATVYDVKTGVIGPGATVELTGVVTGVSAPRFWLQVPELEHHPELGYTYSGIFVYISTDNPDKLFIPQRGDYVRVVGDVEDWWGQLELSWVQSLELIEGNTPLPDPVMELAANVGTGGELADAYEGVLMLIAEAEVTELNPPAGSGDTDPTNEYVLDDALRVNDYFYLTEPFPEIGQNMTVMGILRWANDDSKLEPRDEMDIIPELDLKELSPALVFVNQGALETQTVPPLTVQLNTWAGVDGVVVTLESSDPLRLTVPDSIAVPPGAMSVAVPVVPLAGGTEPVTVTATLGDKSVQALVLVISPDTVPKPAEFQPETAQLVVDGTVEIMLVLDIPGRPGGTEVTLEATDPTVVQVAQSLVVPENEMAALFTITGLQAGTTTVKASTTAGELFMDVDVIEVPPVGFIVTEVYYNSPGADGGKEWVELFNGTGQPVDLSAHSLGNAGTNYSGSTAQLAGVLAPGECFVVGGPISDADNGMPVYDQVLDFDPDLQNSGDAADAVGLFSLPAGQINNASVPIDAVVYGAANSNGLVDETGEVNEPDINNVSAGSSLQRTPDGWLAQPDPTPGDCSHAYLSP